MRDAPTAETVRKLPYVELLALAGESNLPPGGVDSIRRLVVNAHLRPDHDVLHAGSSAGFLARELARRAGCRVTGVDVAERMVAAARRRAAAEGLTQLVRYERADMRDTGLEAESFDLVVSGGALAFVAGGQRPAVEEWLRLVRPFGLVAAIELYYGTDPPDRLLAAVSDAIGVAVPRYRREHWTRLFDHERLQPWYEHDGDAGARSDAEVRAYCEAMTGHVAAGWPDAAREALAERWLALFSLFNENMKHLRYVLLIRRCVPAGAEPALFL